jgi:hypothetical protein
MFARRNLLGHVIRIDPQEVYMPGKWVLER